MNSKKMITAVLAAGLLAFAGALKLAAQASLVQFHGPLARVITPNGDRINDIAFFCFENPQDSDISGKVYTLLGAQVATMGPKTDRSGTAGAGCAPSVIRAQFVSWDGSANGSRVDNGLYVYRIESEGRSFSGTLLVVR